MTDTSTPIVGVDIGGTKCAVLIGSPDGEILHKTVFPTDTAGGLDKTLQNLWKAIAEMLTHTNGQPPVFGISCGGPMNSSEGLVLSPPNLPGWDRVPIAKLITDRFGGRAYLMNDANAGALAEWTWGAARGTKDAIFLTFGTGMGSGIIINGRMHAGRDDLAGEVGHVRMADEGPVGFNKAGSFEGFCSGGGITRLAQSRIRAAWQRGETVGFCADAAACEKLALKTVADAARAGDPLAKGVFETSAFYLGRGLAILVDILNPEVIAIGSVFARCEDLLRPTAMRVLAELLQCGFPCVAMTAHAALNTAVANDVAADLVFAQQVYSLGRRGDVLMGLSTSGNSANVVNAFKVARVAGLRTIALTGQGGGKLAPLADVIIRVPGSCTPVIQELHLPVYHTLCAAVEAHFFG